MILEIRLRLLCIVTLFLVIYFSATSVSKTKTRSSRAITKTAPAKPSTPSKREEGDFVIEKRTDGSTVKYKKRNTYDFEGASIEGLIKSPSGSYISNVKEVKGKSIIRIRENFDTEVIDSARQLR